MQTLQLIIKEHFLNDIVSGKKKKETRDIRPKNVKKYAVEKPDGSLVVRQYDQIQFYAGYNTDRKQALVKVKGAEIIILVDAEGEPLAFTENGVEYVEAIVEYKLGIVISSNYKN